jgi:hypothetical protein
VLHVSGQAILPSHDGLRYILGGNGPSKRPTEKPWPSGAGQRLTGPLLVGQRCCGNSGNAM